MPFVFDIANNAEFDKETEEFLAPKPDQFIYIPPPKFGGAHEPVDISKFFIAKDAQPKGKEPQGIIKRLKSLVGVGTSRPVGLAVRETPISTYVIPALDNLDVLRIYCRYDGGQDEGFAWMEQADLKTGEQLSEAELINKLSETNLADQLMSSDIFKKRSPKSSEALIEEVVRYWVCDEWASWLLGRGFGTGEFSMFGAFTVDFRARSIYDDARAAPVVENIELDLGEN